jgi:hypothetical protein
MITRFAAAAASCADATTWPDVVCVGVVVAGACVFFWLRWR